MFDELRTFPTQYKRCSVAEIQPLNDLILLKISFDSGICILDVLDDFRKNVFSFYQI